MHLHVASLHVFPSGLDPMLELRACFLAAHDRTPGRALAACCFSFGRRKRHIPSRIETKHHLHNSSESTMAFATIVAAPFEPATTTPITIDHPSI
jgi:hypothetical protein